MTLTIPMFFWGGWVLILLLLAIIDYRTQRLPDSLTLGLLWMGLLYHNTYSPDLSPYLWGAVFAYVILQGITRLFAAIRHQEGLGQGDIKLCAALGATLGITALPKLLLYAACLGILGFGLRWLIYRRSLQTHCAFGPAIVIAALGIRFIPWL